MTNEEELTKISFNAIPKAVAALELASNVNGLSRTDTLNRAIQIYAAIVSGDFETAMQIPLSERVHVLNKGVQW